MTLIIIPPFEDIKEAIPSSVGDTYAGGFFAGIYVIAGKSYALVLSPKAGQSSGLSFGPNTVISGLSQSDGWANTERFKTTAYPANHFTRGLLLGGYDDWYTPALDELEMLYRAFKPTTQSNFVGVSNGLQVVGDSRQVGTNPSSGGAAYTASSPAQTSNTLFRSGGAQVMLPSTTYLTHWCSSGSFSSSNQYMHCQEFNAGKQSVATANDARLTVRAVRRVAL